MTAAEPVTLESLRGLPYRLVFHARLGGGGYVFVRRCVRHPRLTIEWKRDNLRSPERRTAYVDGTVCATVEMVVERLYRPPEEPAPPPQLELRL